MHGRWGVVSRADFGPSALLYEYFNSFLFVIVKKVNYLALFAAVNGFPERVEIDAVNFWREFGPHFHADIDQANWDVDIDFVFAGGGVGDPDPKPAGGAFPFEGFGW